MPILGKTLTPDKVCKDLGVYLDSGLTFDTHIDTLMSSLFTTLSKINRVQHFFDKSILLIILNSLVFCKLFYFCCVSVARD